MAKNWFKHWPYSKEPAEKLAKISNTLFVIGYGIMLVSSLMLFVLISREANHDFFVPYLYRSGFLIIMPLACYFSFLMVRNHMPVPSAFQKVAHYLTLFYSLLPAFYFLLQRIERPVDSNQRFLEDNFLMEISAAFLMNVLPPIFLFALFVATILRPKANAALKIHSYWQRIFFVIVSFVFLFSLIGF